MNENKLYKNKNKPIFVLDEAKMDLDKNTNLDSYT